MCRLKLVLPFSLIVLTWASLTVAQVPSSKTMPTPPVPGKSLPFVPTSGRVARSFSADGIKRLYLRAGDAESAQVKSVPGRQLVTLSAVPEGDAKGYHTPDPNWSETPAAKGGLDFVARRYGSALVISSKNEIRYIHHYYHLADIVLEVPPGIEAVRENRTLSGAGNADLNPPDGKKH